MKLNQMQYVDKRLDELKMFEGDMETPIAKLVNEKIEIVHEKYVNTLKFLHQMNESQTLLIEELTERLDGMDIKVENALGTAGSAARVAASAAASASGAGKKEIKSVIEEETEELVAKTNLAQAQIDNIVTSGTGTISGITWDQVAPSATWIIPHVFTHQPQVQSFDDSGERVYGEETHQTNQVTIKFSKAISGKARLD